MAGQEAQYQVDLTPYLIMDADIWFGMLEYFFSIYGIEDERQRFDYMLETLPSSIGQTADHLLRRGPVHKSYSCMKHAILENIKNCKEFYDIRQMSTEQKMALYDKLNETINGFRPWSEYQTQIEKLIKLLN